MMEGFPVAGVIMQLYYDKDVDASLLQGKTIAVIGYGSQGEAQAQIEPSFRSPRRLSSNKNRAADVGPCEGEASLAGHRAAQARRHPRRH